MSNDEQSAGDVTGEAYNRAADSAGDAYDQAGDRAQEAYDYSGKAYGELADNFKPDPAIVWQGYLIYTVLAFGSSLPWWTLITAVDYFQFLYPGVHVIRYFIFAYFGAWLLTYLLVNTFWRQGTSWRKVTLGLSLAIVILVLIPFLEAFIGNQGTTATLWVTLIAVAVAGVADGLSRGSILGISVELPEGFIKAYSRGFTASGIVMFIIRVITKASLNSSPSGLKVSGILHFAFAALLVVLVLSVFAYVHYMPAMSYYNSLNLGNIDTLRFLIQDAGTVSIEIASGAAIASIAAGRESTPQPLRFRRAVDKVQLLAIGIFLTSVVTFSIFPSYLTEDVYSSTLKSWYPVLLVGTFAIFELVGGFFAGGPRNTKQSVVVGVAFARVLLLVVFVLALVFGPNYASWTAVIFLLTVILGASNGYLVVTTSSLFPKNVTVNEAEVAGILSASLMTAGILVGAGLGWLFLLAK